MEEIELKIRSSRRKQQILFLLSNNKFLYQAQIARKLNITNVTLGDHMKVLENLGLVKRSISGKFVFYSLTEAGKVILNRLE